MPLLAGIYVACLYWLIVQKSGAHRPDYFALVNSWLHGQLWSDPILWRVGERYAYDVVVIADRLYFPYPPLPALLLLIPSALIGPDRGPAFLYQLEPVLNTLIAGINVGLCWVLLSRFDAGRVADRIWLTVFFAFSTMHWWVTVLGGPWHMTQLLATTMTFLALLEATGRRRPWFLGVLGGAAFLARNATMLALPFYAWLAAFRDGRPTDPPGWRCALGRAMLVGLGFAPAVAFTLWYNAARFGSPLESGYGLAQQAPWLDGLRSMGLFSLAHLPRNLDFLLWHLPLYVGPPDYFKPDGYGMSVFLTSPAILLAMQANLRDPRILGAAATAALVLVPSLLYFGGGYYQLGFRYFLDSTPFVMLLMASAVGGRALTWPWKLLIVCGVFVVGWGMRWAWV